MKITIRTAHGYLSFQPDGRLEYRQAIGPWEELEVGGLEVLVKPPVPIDPSTPVEVWPPSATADYVADVKAHLQAAGINTAGAAGAFEVIKHVAWGLRQRGVGLLRKDTGENVVAWHGINFSAGRLCYPDGHIFKLLTDVGGANGPTWADDGDVDPARYVPAIDPAT
jgi:hypothetical protein